ncbi:unnamed protein product, partial [Prorocentrum cordatum]
RRRLPAGPELQGGAGRGRPGRAQGRPAAAAPRARHGPRLGRGGVGERLEDDHGQPQQARVAEDGRQPPRDGRLASAGGQRARPPRGPAAHRGSGGRRVPGAVGLRVGVSPAAEAW